MHLPALIQQVYGVFTFTGLYSFEFVSNGKKITEIFFMVPPKSKSVDEATRSTTNPTLASNYNTDAGNSTKIINIKGELWFPSVGSPKKPLATGFDSNDTKLIDGLTEFMSMRWYLMRYRDYTLTKNSKMDIPLIPMNASQEVVALYRKASKLVKNKSGALYDNIQLIFHDYDMDDHGYCRVARFNSSQSDSKYIAIEYDIELEIYQKYIAQTGMKVEVKRTRQEQVDINNALLQGTELSTQLASSTLFLTGAL